MTLPATHQITRKFRWRTTTIVATTVTLAAAGLAITQQSASAATFNQVGWATQCGGTSGGGSASPVTVTTASALADNLKASGSRVIRVSGTINVSGMQKVTANKTIIGVGGGATITGGGLNVSKVSNVIIRNINFRNWSDDAIQVETSTRVWIDHNTLSNGKDGAIDIKRGSDCVTVSWNRLFSHDKAMLLGHSDGNASQDRGKLRVTYAYNYLDGTTQRHPRVRFGNPVHVVNNYYRNIGSYGVASTKEACVIVEGNYFENVKDPFHRGEGDSPAAALVARNNHFVGSGSGQAGGGSCKSLGYSLSVDSPSSVKNTVVNGAGAGKI